MGIPLAVRLSLVTARLRPQRRTVRFRLTALYSALFLAAGAGLLAITYALVDGTTAAELFIDKNGTAIAVSGPQAAQLSDGHPSTGSLPLARELSAQAAAQHARDLHQLLTQSGLALAIMAVLAIGLGWLAAGRVLRPLRAMKTATQQITERNLHERLALPGPGDEVKDLADTIDGLLARLETAFEAQRRFVASASHELRTPLTLNRALLEVALADPGASAGDLRAACEDLLAAGEHQERLIDALLTLAASQQGLDRREPLDLATVTRQALALHYAEAEQRSLRLKVSLGHATVHGNPDLVERMAANLIDNAIRYNLPGGHVEVHTETGYDHAVLTVANTGPLVPEDQVSRLFQPFQRISPDRAGHPDGHGLGLSIVRAIAAAHDASLKVQLRAGGGLSIEVHFPACADGNGHRPLVTGTSAKDRHSREDRSPIQKDQRTYLQEGPR
jgi:signal transduction histidine kinase